MTHAPRFLVFAAVAFGALLSRLSYAEDICVTCHEQETPGIVNDWKSGKHAEAAVSCSACHGEGHKTAEDPSAAAMPTPETCGNCHAGRVEQYKKGKHAFAWAAMNAMPTTHALPQALIAGQKGCGGCHKIGLSNDEDAKAGRDDHAGGYGGAACDACHTRHSFSREEAKQPQACQTCHMGFDHPQWEMYSSSKHGVRHGLKQIGKLPASAAAPTCQDCHMQDGDHEVRTPWGFLAVRLPLPEDPQWKTDQVTILQALGVLDPDGNPTARLDVVKAAQVARLTQEEFDAERAKLMKVCSNCHSEAFAATQMENGDAMIREADHLLAEAIRVIANLYKDGVLSKPESYAYAFPDLLTFHDAPRRIEHRLFEMHLKHRMRAFQGVFHANPDYALWYGWSEMVRDLADIREMAAALRREHAAGR